MAGWWATGGRIFQVLGALVILAVGATEARAEVGCDEDGALVMANDGDPAVYYMLRGRRWHLPNEQVTWALELSFDGVCRLKREKLDAIPRGPGVGLTGSLFLCPTCGDNVAVYRIEDGVRRHIANEHVLHDCLSLRDEDIFTAATPAFRDLFPPGWELEADCDPGDVEADSCGACGRKLRTCEASCRWSDWSVCVGGEDACGWEPAGAELDEAPPHGCAGGVGRGLTAVWMLAAAWCVRRLARR